MNSAKSYHAVIDTPLPGAVRLGLSFTAQGLSQIDVLPHSVPLQHADHKQAGELISQLQSYFSNPAFVFSMPLALEGTPFQQKVWAALQQLPVGTRCSYGELANRLNSGARAVAGACRANPLPIIVPCHRVVAANGLGGYMGQIAGQGLAMKEWLLSHEGAD
jgi:methylated-DNA-[protein]-cysteine S-methyltransferase